jgi:large repetitive protein
MLKKLRLLLLLFIVAFTKTQAQFTATTTPSISATQIVQKFAGKGIVISNASLSCPNGAAGFFNNTATTLNMDSGIVLTTGNVLTYTSGGTTNYGINSGAAFSAKTDNQVTGGDADLIASAGVPSTGLHDLCKIEFDFVPLSDSIKFNYRFGSEEYPSFNCTNFSDIFAFYISGPGFVGNTNIALIPGTAIPVSVNSINDGSILYGNITNCNNLGAGSPFTSLYANNAASSTIVYNGLTQILQARAIVIPCSTYHMKIAIADLGDGDRDSGVFLDANSLTSEVATIEKIVNPNSVTLSTPFVMEGCNPDTIYIKRPTAKPTPLVVGISTAGTASPGSDYICPTTVTIPANATTATFVVSANQDNIAEGTETIKLYIYGSPCVNIITDSATISLLEFPIYNVSDNDTICNGQCTNLSANIITATPYLTFLWNPGNHFGNTYNVCPIATSTYTCSAQYPGCTDRDSLVKITVAPLPIVNAGADVSICNGASTTLNGSVSNYAPYTISTQWTPTAGLNNSNVLNAIASPSNTTTYSLSATSSAGCTATDAMIVTVGAPISINASTNNVLCNGAATGTATITATGTIGAVTYLLQPSGASNNTGIFTGLAATNYTVTVTDAITCSKTFVFNISQAPIINIINTTALAPGCNGASNGSINISANGGTGAISYTLTPGNVNNTTGIFLNLNANTYTIVCKDANLCTKSTVVIITQPSALSFATASKTNITCNGLANGTITTNATGGTPGYSYTLSPGNITNITGFYNNLNIGTYTVNCTDNKGCTIATTLNITQPLGMAFNAPITTAPTCAIGNNGAITNTVTGGAPSYSYNLTPGNITNTTGSFSGLGIGAFVITATDANGCTKSNIVNLSFPNAPAFNTVTSIGVSCNGNTNGSITATTTGGTGAISFSLLPVGTSGGVGNFINLAANTYTISATDASGCKTTSSVIVNTPLLLNIGSVVSSGVLCNNGASGVISINMAGGTPAYTFTATPGGASNSTGIFNSLATNTYTINIVDSKGCTKSTTVFISNPTAINWVSVSKTNILCFNAQTGTINSSANGGTGILTYSLQGTALSNTNGAFTGIGAGTYTLIVTDANACTKSSIVVITQPTDIISNSSNITNASCVPGNDGSFTVASSGGIGPYTYSSGGVTNATGTFINQGVGGHATIVTDGNGCKDTITVVITTPPAPAIGQVLYVLPKVCEIDSSDSVKVIMFIPGTFTFSINPGGTTNTTGLFTNLPSGNYVITVKDANGCTANTNVQIKILLPLQTGFNTTIMFTSQYRYSYCYSIGRRFSIYFY